MSNISLLMAIAAVVVILMLAGENNTAGSDELAKDAIQEIERDYRPWFNPIWSPDKRTETLLFSLQAAVGILIILYFFGHSIKGK